LIDLGRYTVTLCLSIACIASEAKAKIHTNSAAKAMSCSVRLLGNQHIVLNG